MKLEKARDKLKNSNDPLRTLLYHLSLDVELLKRDVRWLKWLVGFILAAVLTLLAKAIAF